MVIEIGTGFTPASCPDCRASGWHPGKILCRRCGGAGIIPVTYAEITARDGIPVDYALYIDDDDDDIS